MLVTRPSLSVIRVPALAIGAIARVLRVVVAIAVVRAATVESFIFGFCGLSTERVWFIGFACGG